MDFMKQFEPEPLKYLKDLHARALRLPTMNILGAKVYDVSTLQGKDRKWLSDMSCCYGMKNYVD